jgi:stage II sporulation protein GA (sporulation sigma-E factor processing peptidase)
LTNKENGFSYNGFAAKENPMHYVIYPDTLFLENFICNLVFLTFLKSLFFPAAKGKRIFLTAVVTALCNTLVSILFFRCSLFLQIMVLLPAAGLMVCGCMEVKDRRRILFLQYQLMLWIFAIGGVIQALEQWTKMKSKELLITVAIAGLIFGILEKIFKIYKRQNECLREVTLCRNGKQCHIKGFADTGNHLVDPISKKPVSIITLEAWHTLLEKGEIPLYRLIPYKAIGKPQGILKGIEIDYMVILEGENSQMIERPMIAVTKQPFTGIFHYSILLHSDYF